MQLKYLSLSKISITFRKLHSVSMCMEMRVTAVKLEEFRCCVKACVQNLKMLRLEGTSGGACLYYAYFHVVNSNIF